MIGNGKNVKSMAYVGNVVAFIEYCLNNENGEHLFFQKRKADIMTIEDYKKRKIRITEERLEHIYTRHPETKGEIEKNKTDIIKSRLHSGRR